MMWCTSRHVYGIVMAPKKELFQLGGLRCPKTQEELRSIAQTCLARLEGGDTMEHPKPVRTIVFLSCSVFFSQIAAAATRLGIRFTNLWRK